MKLCNHLDCDGKGMGKKNPKPHQIKTWEFLWENGNDSGNNYPSLRYSIKRKATILKL